MSDMELADVTGKLTAIRTALFRQDSIQIVVTCEESMVDSIAERLTGFRHWVANRRKSTLRRFVKLPSCFIPVHGSRRDTQR